MRRPASPLGNRHDWDLAILRRLPWNGTWISFGEIVNAVCPEVPEVTVAKRQEIRDRVADLESRRMLAIHPSACGRMRVLPAGRRFLQLLGEGCLVHDLVRRLTEDLGIEHDWARTCTIGADVFAFVQQRDRHLMHLVRTLLGKWSGVSSDEADKITEGLMMCLEEESSHVRNETWREEAELRFSSRPRQEVAS